MIRHLAAFTLILLALYLVELLQIEMMNLLMMIIVFAVFCGVEEMVRAARLKRERDDRFRLIERLASAFRNANR